MGNFYPQKNYTTADSGNFYSVLMNLILPFLLFSAAIDKVIQNGIQTAK
jgi:hypothetical protein